MITANDLGVRFWLRDEYWKFSPDEEKMFLERCKEREQQRIQTRAEEYLKMSFWERLRERIYDFLFPI